MNLITCKNISFVYDGVPAVKDLDFSVEPNDYLCIVGENGAGKSTLVKGLLRLKKPASGTIHMGNGLLAKEIGYLPQQTAVQKDFPASVYELIEKIAGNTGLTKKDVGIVINTFIVTVTKALVEGSKVQLLGFGVFGTRERNARKVRNPRTGESIDLAASTVPYFKPGKILRDVVKSINHPI